jgi:hypothetical protein
MPLDDVGRRYADRLYQESQEALLRDQQAELTRVRQDFASRNMTQSGAFLTEQVRVLIRNAETLINARVDSVLRAYEQSGTDLDEPSFRELSAEASTFAQQHGRNIVHAIQNQIGTTYGSQVPQGVQSSIANSVERGISGITSRTNRRLAIMQDERALTARRPSLADSNVVQAAAAAPRANSESDQLQARRAHLGLEPKPQHYYWKICEKIGEESYRTWRGELLSALVVATIIYLMTKTDDPLAWKNFEIASAAIVFALLAFALLHAVRAPWLLHRQAIIAEEPPIRWRFRIFGAIVLVLLVAGINGFFLFARKPAAPPIVKFAPPPVPQIQQQVQQNQPKQTQQHPSQSPQRSDHPDRVLTEQETDHLYQRLKEFATEPATGDGAAVTIAPYAYQDQETSHLAWQLAKTLEDAHWKVTKANQIPIKLEGHGATEIPTGIWVLSDKETGAGFLLWSSLKEVGLNSELRPRSDLPPDFKGVILLVGYKWLAAY